MLSLFDEGAMLVYVPVSRNEPVQQVAVDASEVIAWLGAAGIPFRCCFRESYATIKPVDDAQLALLRLRYF